MRHEVRPVDVAIGPGSHDLGVATHAADLYRAGLFPTLVMVCLKVLAPNRAGIRAYEKAGFRTVGALRQAGYWLGKVCDEIVMDAVADEFTGPSVITPLVPG
ncbi:GNAT family N-acetyltransferase [Streptomyces uncialis]|uniref:GNAT family N-acetyltransferase n=1 Tax=Streptomyces uncialis TaxID=1048205 RepID=UPI003816B5AE